MYNPQNVEKSGFGQSVCVSVWPSVCLAVAFPASSHRRILFQFGVGIPRRRPPPTRRPWAGGRRGSRRQRRRRARRRRHREHPADVARVQAPLAVRVRSPGPCDPAPLRPVRLPDRGDPAEAAQARELRVVVGELLIVQVGFVAPAPAQLRHPHEAAGPQTARLVVARHQEDVPGLEPVQLAERLVRVGHDGQHEHVEDLKVERVQWGLLSPRPSPSTDCPGGLPKRDFAAPSETSPDQTECGARGLWGCSRVAWTIDCKVSYHNTVCGGNECTER